ncbi:hypothetical protein ACFQ51_49690 [Streptomyces kaempferi]
MSTLETVHRTPYTNHTAARPVHQQRSDGLPVAFSLLGCRRQKALTARG